MSKYTDLETQINTTQSPRMLRDLTVKVNTAAQLGEISGKQKVKLTRLLSGEPEPVKKKAPAKKKKAPAKKKK